MATLAKRLENAQARAEITRLNKQQLEDKAAIRHLEHIQNKYDALTNPTTGGQRRVVRTERKSEDNLHTTREKVSGMAFARDLQRNFAGFAALQRQMRVCVVGTGPKLSIKTGTNFDASAQDFFRDWSKWCDGVDDQHLYDIVGNALNSVCREGDVLFVFDDFDRMDGRLRVYESDQIVEIEQGDWDEKAREYDLMELKPGETALTPMMQENGVVRDYRGRVIAYIFTNEPGLSCVKGDKATIVRRWDPVDNPNGSAKLYKMPWRFNQFRGQGLAWTIANQQQDAYEMQAAELQSAKNAASNYAFIEVDKDAEGGIVRALEKSNLTVEEQEKIIYGDGENPGLLGTQYEELEALTGGRTTYGNPGERVHLTGHDRPAQSVRDHVDWSQEQSGAVFGLARSRSTLRAQSSYTAFRGEEVMSWQAVECYQKSLERSLLDWLALKAITFGLQKRQIVTAPAGWSGKLVWAWPKMREVNELVTANAQGARIKHGLSNYEMENGPDGEKLHGQLAAELENARQLGIPLSVFETTSGAERTEEKEDE